MVKKQFAVFGLGKFGKSVAESLADAGYEVIAVDMDEEKVQDISDKVTYAARADVTEPGVMESLGVKNVDAAVVAISTNMEASIMATILAKEAGVPYVMNKATSQMHAKVLKKIGSDEVIFPEKAMGNRVAKKLMTGNFLDLFELSESFSMVEAIAPKEWVGKNLKELNVRTRHGVNIIGIKTGDKVDVKVNPDEPIQENSTLIMVGKNIDLTKILEL
ncbi:MAG: TrkA family potassium uptake protein [Lachnospiraceae bacterium]|nr:TrkA family potassium uptake protein [Lachnospiraceae bacterium]